MKLIVMLFALSVAGVGQSALVVQLSPQDASRAKATHQAMLDAEKKWNDMQSEISQKYLIVDKDDPNASDQRWYTAEDVFFSGTASTATWSTLSVDANGYLVSGRPCETEAEKKARADAQAKAEQEAKKREAEREAKSRRWRKNWYQKSFEFSDDFKFIVPKHEEAKPYLPSWINGATLTSPVDLAAQSGVINP